MRVTITLTVIFWAAIGALLFVGSVTARDQSPEALDQRMRAETVDNWRTQDRLQKQIDELKQRVEKLEATR